MKNDTELANLFGAFAHPSRIAVLRNLLANAPNGANFGRLAKAVSLSPSTLTHHLREMEKAGVLIRQEQGRSTQFHLNLDVLDSAIQQLTSLCCSAENTDLRQRTIK